MSVTTEDKVKRTWGYVAEFDTAASVYEAAKAMKEGGYRRWDVHSPFPIHGMDGAMGLGPSFLSRIVFCGGLAGSLTALLLQFGTQVGLYPTIVQGKPDNLFTIPAFFPVTFELTILFSAFTILFSLLVIIRLPRLHHPLFESKLFTGFSDDKFILSVEARDPKFAREGTREFLQSIGAKQVELVEEEL
ncbi:MAG: DUF3341 domain-containing protein [Verrucomicrobia bacterium]|nr:DUF3341 domain-containing protein [Verrucomicrobiota bacterium]